MGVNRFMGPSETHPIQTYVDQHVPLPFEIMQRAAENRQKVYDVNEQQAEVAKSWLNIKHRAPDKVGYNRIKNSYEKQISDLVDQAGGDYSTIGPKIRAVAATIKSDMNDGELAHIMSNFANAQADVKHKTDLVDKGDLSGLNSMNMLATSDAGHVASVDPEKGYGDYSAYANALDIDPNKELATQLSHMKASSRETLGGTFLGMKAGETTHYAMIDNVRKEITKEQIESIVKPYLDSNPKLTAYLERNVRALYGEKAYDKALADILATATGTFNYSEDSSTRTMLRDHVGEKRAEEDILNPAILEPATDVQGLISKPETPGKSYTEDKMDMESSGQNFITKGGVHNLLAELNPGKKYDKGLTDKFFTDAMVTQGIIPKGTLPKDISPRDYNKLMVKIADGDVSLSTLTGPLGKKKSKAIQKMAIAEVNRVEALKDREEEALDKLREDGLLSEGQVKIMDDFPNRKLDLKASINKLPNFNQDQKDEIFEMVVNGDNLKKHEATNAYNGVKKGIGYGKVSDLASVNSFRAYKDSYEKMLAKSDVKDNLENIYTGRNAYSPTTSIPTTGNFSLDDGTDKGIQDGGKVVRNSLNGKAMELYTNKQVTDSQGNVIPMKTIVDQWVKRQREPGKELDPVTSKEVTDAISTLNTSASLMAVNSSDGKKLWHMSNGTDNYYLNLSFGPDAEQDTRTYAFKNVNLQPELENKQEFETAKYNALVSKVERYPVGDHRYGVYIHTRKPESEEESKTFVTKNEEGSNYNISIDPRKYGIDNMGKRVMIPQSEALEFQKSYTLALKYGKPEEIKDLVRSYLIEENTQ